MHAYRKLNTRICNTLMKRGKKSQWQPVQTRPTDICQQPQVSMAPRIMTICRQFWDVRFENNALPQQMDFKPHVNLNCSCCFCLGSLSVYILS